MDFGDGRDRRRLIPLISIIFTDPYSGHEILTFIDQHTKNVFGVVYHPQRTDPVVPWRSGCKHCLGGKQESMDLHLKRQIQMLCTLNPKENGVLDFFVPTNSQPYLLSFKEDSPGWIVTVSKNDVSTDVAWKPKSKMEFSGDPRQFQSNILLRSLKFLFSRRNSKHKEIVGCLGPLIREQKRSGIAVGNRRSCCKIDWSFTLLETK
jgi:hypothetical protein